MSVLLYRLGCLLLAVGLMSTPVEAGLARPPPSIASQLGHSHSATVDNPVTLQSSAPTRAPARVATTAPDEDEATQAPGQAIPSRHQRHSAWGWVVLVLALAGAAYGYQRRYKPERRFR